MMCGPNPACCLFANNVSLTPQRHPFYVLSMAAFIPQLTLEQHGFDLQRPKYMQILEINTINILFFSLY